MILINHANASVGKERLSPLSKASREGSQPNEFVKKSGMPDRVKNLDEVDCSKNCLRTRLGFVKPIRNGTRKIENLIKSRLSRAKSGLAARENEVKLQKEE